MAKKRTSLIPLFAKAQMKKAMSRRFALSARKIFRRKNLPAKKKSVLVCLSRKRTLLFFLLPTLYLLFIDDIVGASGAPQTTSLLQAVGILKFITFVVFLAEMLLSIYAKGKDYVISILFLLDLISIISLIPDLLDFFFAVGVEVSLKKLSLARISRSARLATRMARMARMGKMIDIMSWGKHKRTDDNESVGVQPSRLGYRLVTKTTTKVMVVVLLVILVVTLCNADLDEAPYAMAGLSGLEVIASNSGFNSSLFEQALSGYYQNNKPILFLEVMGQTIVNLDSLPYTQAAYQAQFSTLRSTVIFSEQAYQQLDFGLSILETFLVILLLAGGCLLITHDAMTLVITPFEKMLGLIRKLTMSAKSTYDETMSSTVGYSEEPSPDSSVIDLDEEAEYDEEDAVGEEEEVMYTLDSSDGEQESILLVETMGRLTQEHLKNNLAKYMEFMLKKSYMTMAAAFKGYLERKRFAKTCDMYKQRANIAKEILSSERYYVNALKNLVTYYINPLRSGTLLDGEEMDLMFSKIDSILEYNSHLVEQFDERILTWSVHTQLSDIFEKMIDIADVYAGYINGYDDAIETLQRCREKKEDFAAFLEEQKLNPSCNGLDISALLIMPIQRMPRYILLLDQLKKNTPEDHCDYTKLGAALVLMKSVATDLNERKRQMENKLTVQDFYMALDPPVEQLMSSKCSFMKKGPITYEGEEHVGLLFSNVFILSVSENNGERFSVKRILATKNCTVTSIVDSPHLGLQDGFQIDGQSDKLLLCSPAKSEWLEALYSCTKLKDVSGSSSSGTVKKKRASTATLASSSGIASSGGGSPSSANLNVNRALERVKSRRSRDFNKM